jgi:hypothetical protein
MTDYSHLSGSEVLMLRRDSLSTNHKPKNRHCQFLCTFQRQVYRKESRGFLQHTRIYDDSLLLPRTKSVKQEAEDPHCHKDNALSQKINCLTH